MAVSEYTQGLRDLADWLDEHPQFTNHAGDDGVRLYQFTWDKDSFIEQARAIGGPWDKDSDSGYYMLVKSFGPHRVELNIAHEEVCERVQIGTKVVEKHDPDVLAALPKIKVEEPQYEWVCPPSILASVSE